MKIAWALLAVVCLMGNATAASAETWNSVAWAVWTDGSGAARVAAGYGVGNSKKSAQKSALNECKKAGGGKRCKLKGAYNSGCYYVTTGKGADGVSVGSGADEATALSQCQYNSGNTYSCRTPIGGCVNN